MTRPPADMRTRYLPNTSLESYWHFNLSVV